MLKPDNVLVLAADVPAFRGLPIAVGAGCELVLESLSGSVLFVGSVGILIVWFILGVGGLALV
jgi:hypothetical protein